MQQRVSRRQYCLVGWLVVGIYLDTKNNVQGRVVEIWTWRRKKVLTYEKERKKQRKKCKMMKKKYVKGNNF